MASLNDIMILNAEIAALVRAGIPLELGLRRLSQSVSGRLAQLTERILVRLENGDSLVTAIRAEEDTVSPLYAAVMEAGIKADRLPSALEGLVRFGRTLQATRRQVRLALVYPFIISIIAYTFVILFALWLLPATLQRSDPLSEIRNRWLENLGVLQAHAYWWIPLIPLAAYCLLRLCSWIGRHWSDIDFLASEPGGGGLFTGTWVPGIPGVYQNLDRAHIAQVLALLLENHVPLPEALALSARMSGSRKLRHSLSRLSLEIENGQPLVQLAASDSDLPPLLAQLFRSGSSEQELANAIGLAADIFRQRAERRTAWVRATLVPAFSVVFGGGIALGYALIFGLPLRWLYIELLNAT